jgi:hypothetical protein
MIMTENVRPPASIFTSSSFGVVRQIRCGGKDCTGPAALRLDSQTFCLDHLVAHCLDRLESCEQKTLARAEIPEETHKSDDRFLGECTSKVAGFLMARSDLTNMDRARLLDILLWATQLDDRYARRAEQLRKQKNGDSRF